MKTSNQASPAETLKFLFVTRGVISVLFGIMALVWPGLTVATFALLITVWFLLSGVINIVRGIMSIGDGHGWIFTLLLAVLQIGIGAYLIQRPSLAVATIVALISIVFVVEGVIAVIVPFIEGKAVSTGAKIADVIIGLLAIVAGITIWRYPVSGTLAFVWVVGLFALISGPIWIVQGLHLRNLE